jgi:hypothetical protein
MTRPGSKWGVGTRLAGTALAVVCVVVPMAGGTAYAAADGQDGTAPTAVSAPTTAPGLVPSTDWNSEGGWCVHCVPPVRTP